LSFIQKGKNGSMEQQDQTLTYFKSHARDWQTKAMDQDYNLIENRHNAVLESMRNFPSGSSLLDVGCGTGQLAIQASKLGWSATGIDFAQEMIDLCLSNSKGENAKAEFVCTSVFDYDASSESFDVVSAQGFIEYITLEQLDEFIDFAKRILKKKGKLALGSRNRLFNLHSLNEFTELETALGTAEHLMLEARIIQTAKTQQEAIEALKLFAFEYVQPKIHPRTGVKVDTRYQFSPADLMMRLRKHGLNATRIFPVHYHPLPVALLKEGEFKTTHNYVARLASDRWITHHNLVPYSSSFVLEAQKK
jgi:2-polyprenyl-3-methyl-5-hydroxy-6-metoxy-1,4-benzoquinol methylase